MSIEQGIYRGIGAASEAKQDDMLNTLATEETLQGLAGFNIPAHDYWSVAYPTTVQEVYTYKTGGSGGTTVATVTINYTDSTKEYPTNGSIL